MAGGQSQAFGWRVQGPCQTLVPLELFSEFAKQTFSPADKIVERSGEGFPWREQSLSQHLESRGAQVRSHGAPRQPYYLWMGHFLRILGCLEKYFFLKEPEACMSVMQSWRHHPRVMRESAVLLCGPSCGWHGPEEWALDLGVPSGLYLPSLNKAIFPSTCRKLAQCTGEMLTCSQCPVSPSPVLLMHAVDSENKISPGTPVC